jgi:Holliday junction resolvase RusA-like endonuclease
MLTPEEIARGLIAQGVPRDRAEARARAVYDAMKPSRPLLAAFKAIEALPVRPSVAPITLRIPWSALVSDDDKYAPALRKGKPVIILTETYRTAKARMTKLAVDTMAGRPAMTVPLAFVGRVWVPNNHRRDVHNFSKCCLDAMSKVIYADDSQLHDTRWIRAGVDVDAPRAELTITPL